VTPQPPDAATFVPRLLTVEQAAANLNLSRRSVYDYLAAGRLQAVALPALRPREGERAKHRLRRVLIGRATLDQFVDSLVGSGARLDQRNGDDYTRHGKHDDAHTAAEDGAGSGSAAERRRAVRRAR
jgi:excisionase family DNA binding protein